MKSLWDVYIMAEDRVITVVNNVTATDECDALREAGIALMTRKHTSHLLKKAGVQLEKTGKIFEIVPDPCVQNKYITLRAVPDRKVAI